MIVSMVSTMVGSSSSSTRMKMIVTLMAPVGLMTLPWSFLTATKS